MYNPYPFISAKETIDVSKNFEGKCVDCRKARVGSVQMQWSGNKISGEFVVEGSNDGKVFGRINDVQPVIIKEEDSGSRLINLPYMGYNNIRVSYKSKKGTGFISTDLSLKE